MSLASQFQYRVFALLTTLTSQERLMSWGNRLYLNCRSDTYNPHQPRKADVISDPKSYPLAWILTTPTSQERLMSLASAATFSFFFSNSYNPHQPRKADVIKRAFAQIVSLEAYNPHQPRKADVISGVDAGKMPSHVLQPSPAKKG